MNNIIKDANRKNVFKAVYESDGISKQQIAHNLNLSLPTVVQNLQYLSKMGLIHEDGKFESTGGRRAKVIRCSYDAKISIGIDITKNHISTVLLDLKGNIINKQRLKLTHEDKKDYYINVSKIVNEQIKKFDIPKKKILGVGISLPVIVAADNKSIDYASAIKLSEDFYEKISYYLNYKCLLFNDANCAGFAELWRNKTLGNIIYLSLSNSVGGAIINKGEIIYGDSIRAGEFGHITIVPNGRKCYCGNCGCVDAYVRAGLLSDLEDGNIERFFNKLNGGNKEYEEIFQEYLYYLSIIVNNLRMSFDKSVVIGGYTGRYLEPHFSKLEDMIINLNPFDKRKGIIKLSSFTFEASAYGAAIKYIDEFLNSI